MSKYSGSKTETGSQKYFNEKGELISSSTKDNVTDYNNGSIGGDKKSLRYFNSNLFAGVDFYVWKSLYLGAELGLNFKTGKSPNYYVSYDNYSVSYNAKGTITYSLKEVSDGATTTTTVFDGTKTNSTISDTNIYSDKTTQTSFKLFVEPAVRLGWRF